MLQKTEQTEQTKLAIAIRMYLVSTRQDQKPLAEAWGCSQSTVTRFLLGQFTPEAATMLRIFQWSLEKEGT